MKFIFSSLIIGFLFLINCSNVNSEILTKKQDNKLVEKLLNNINNEEIKKIFNNSFCEYNNNIDITDVYFVQFSDFYDKWIKYYNKISNQYNNILNTQKKYNTSQDKAYVFINYNFSKQVDEDAEYWKKMISYLKTTNSKFLTIRNFVKQQKIYILVSNKPICTYSNELKVYAINKDKQKTYNIIDSRYNWLFSYVLLDGDVLEGRSIQTNPVPFKDRDGTLKSVDFQPLFDDYMNDLERIGNDQDITDQRLLKELRDMKNKELTY